MSEHDIAKASDLTNLGVSVQNISDTIGEAYAKIGVVESSIALVVGEIKSASERARDNIDKCALVNTRAQQIAGQIANLAEDGRAALPEIFASLSAAKEFCESHGDLTWGDKVQFHKKNEEEFDHLMDKLEWTAKIVGLHLQVAQTERNKALEKVRHSPICIV